MALKTLNTSMDIPNPFQFRDIYNAKMSIWHQTKSKEFEDMENFKDFKDVFDFK